MKIERVEIGKVKIPLKKPFKTALREVHFAEDIVIRLIADTGDAGFGNAPPTAVITGDSQASVASAVRDVIAPKIVGMDIDNLEGILHTIDTSMLHNSSAKAAVDIAVHDLFGKLHNIPLYRLFGGYRSQMTTNLTISVNSPEDMARDSLEAVAEGYGDLKVKVGTDARLDMERIKTVRSAVGPSVNIRLDANQGWKPKEAVRLIRAIEDAGLGIELIEQPVVACDFEGLKFVTDNVDTDIMADESAFGTREVFKLLAMRACDLINIKLMKAGGLHNAIKIAQMAETMGVACMMGCMLESKVGITAAASIAAAKRNVTRADLDAAVLLAKDPVQGGVCFDKNTILLSESPGLGITAVDGWEPIV